MALEQSELAYRLKQIGPLPVSGCGVTDFSSCDGGDWSDSWEVRGNFWRLLYFFGQSAEAIRKIASPSTQSRYHMLGIEMAPGFIRKRIDKQVATEEIAPLGAMYFKPAGSIFDAQKQDPEFLLLVIDPERIEEYLPVSFTDCLPDSYRYLCLDTDIEAMCERVRIGFMSRAEGLPADAVELVDELLEALVSDRRSRTPDTRYQLATWRLRQTLAFVEENLSEKLSIEVLAEMAGRGPFHFAHAFKEVMGVSPYRYILYRRLLLARTLLADTDLPIAEIAYQAGFSSQSHMGSLVRQKLGVTPMTYRTYARRRTELVKERC